MRSLQVFCAAIGDFEFKKFQIPFCLYSQFLNHALFFVFPVVVQNNHQKRLKFSKTLSKKHKLQSFIPCDSYCICNSPNKVDFALQLGIYGKIINLAIKLKEMRLPAFEGFLQLSSSIYCTILKLSLKSICTNKRF